MATKKQQLIYNKKGGKNAQIGSGINRGKGSPDAPYCENPGPDFTVDDDNEEREEEMSKIKIYMRNHSASYFVRWDWFIGVGLFVVCFLGTFLFALMQLSANYVFPGAVGAERRALLIAAAAFLVKITAGRWTSAHLDPVRSIMSCVTFILTRGRKIGGNAVWMELIKLPIFIIAQWLGWMMALAFLGLWTGTDIKTLDCSVPLPTPAVCDVYPVRDVFVIVASADWMEGLGALLIYGTFVWGERFFGWHYPGILFSALFYGAGHYITHLLWSTATGGSFNFWYWAMTGWFSNIVDPDRAIYIWPAMLAIFIVGIIDILVYYLVDWRAHRVNDSDVVYEKQA